MLKNGTYLKCATCNDSFYASQSRILKGKKYCSKKCQNKSQEGSAGYWLGKKRNNLSQTKASATMFKKGMMPWNKGIKWFSMRGKNSPRWVGNKVRFLHKRIRKSPQYIEWRINVFQRDSYTCKICGQKGGYLQADHIKPFSLFPEMRFELDNGRTLCLECHRKTPTYCKNLTVLKKIYAIPE